LGTSDAKFAFGYIYVLARRGELCCVCGAMRGGSRGEKGTLLDPAPMDVEKTSFPKSKEPQERVGSPLPRLAQQGKHHATCPPPDPNRSTWTLLITDQGISRCKRSNVSSSHGVGQADGEEDGKGVLRTMRVNTERESDREYCAQTFYRVGCSVPCLSHSVVELSQARRHKPPGSVWKTQPIILRGDQPSFRLVSLVSGPNKLPEGSFGPVTWLCLLVA
jgi:hypothetical protein